MLSGRFLKAGAHLGDTFWLAAARCWSLKGPRFSRMSGTYLYCSTWYVGAALACVVCMKQQDQEKRAKFRAHALCGSFYACERLEILTVPSVHCGMRGGTFDIAGRCHKAIACFDKPCASVRFFKHLEGAQVVHHHPSLRMHRPGAKPVEQVATGHSRSDSRAAEVLVRSLQSLQQILVISHRVFPSNEGVSRLVAFLGFVVSSQYSPSSPPRGARPVRR